MLAMVGALGLAVSACSKAKTDAIAIANQGVMAMERGDMDTAGGHLRRAVRLWPQHADAHYHLGLIHLHHRDEPELGVRYFERALQLKPDDVDTRFQLGRYHALAGDLTEAQGLLDAVLAVDPNHAPAWYHKGRGLERGGDLGGADRAYREAAAIDPEYARAFVSLGLMYEAVEAMEASRAVYTEGLRHSPGDGDLLNLAGVAALRAGAHQSAIDHLHRALARDTGRTDALFNLAFAYADAGRLREGARWLRAFMAAADPSDTAVLEVARHLEDALTSELLIRPPEPPSASEAARATPSAL